MKRVIEADDKEELPQVTRAQQPVELRIRSSLKRDKSYFLQKQRESRERNKVMGVIQVGVQVPEKDKDDFLRYARMLIARHMVTICDLETTNPARVALANRNFATIPLLADLQGITGKFGSHADKLIKECGSAISEFYQARVAIADEHTNHDAIVQFASKAAAYSYLAAALWEELEHEITAHKE